MNCTLDNDRREVATRLGSTLDELLNREVSAEDGVPGLIFGVTDRQDTLYEAAYGKRSLATGAPMQSDSVFAAYSTTKAITMAILLQLVESGQIDLDAPARNYLPALGELLVIEGFAPDGDPMLRPPRREITSRMLLLHTAGFGYDFFHPIYKRLAKEHGQPSVDTATRAALMTPLLFDPGERWEYGTSTDWAGLVAEAVTGTALGLLMRQRVFDPLGMNDTGFQLTASMQDRRASMHRRRTDSTVVALDDFVLPQAPEIEMGGHGLYTTVGDYLAFLRMWLNHGRSSDGRTVLRADTVRAATQNGLGAVAIHPLPGVTAAITRDAEFFPGQSKSWSCSFMVNDELAPTGRPAGSLSWAGLCNTYFWIDLVNGIAGYWAAQLFPFFDPACVNGFLECEKAVYGELGVKSLRTPGSVPAQ